MIGPGCAAAAPAAGGRAGPPPRERCSWRNSRIMLLTAWTSELMLEVVLSMRAIVRCCSVWVSLRLCT
eukprot:7801295-Pyramimonas_sp.AAC.1